MSQVLPEHQRVVLDHIVLAGPDLNALVADFTERTGLVPQPGGSHPTGTANYLVRLEVPDSDVSDGAASAYLELIGPDPAQPRQSHQELPFGIDELVVPRVAAYALRTCDIIRTVAELNRAGFNPGAVSGLSRRTPSGHLLEWRLTRQLSPTQPAIPFVIDWGPTRHPSAGLEPVATISAFGIHTQYVDRVRSWLVAAQAVLGAVTELVPPLQVVPAPAEELRLTLQTPRGEVEFR